ncbi:hypothetical protein HID58_017646 [Brassica napus]|uniref:Uncharacterized protein n=1 Tax=Brassica napus TaxID=3708 RepID=A0ABQ8DAA2_BRANA|nr:hypothetical protein HID58_017646 [Brassica napus]
MENLLLAYINTRPSSYNISSPLSISQYILTTNILASTTLMADFNSVADLKPFKTMWRVRQYSAPGGLTIEMVLIDSNSISYPILSLVYILVLKLGRVTDFAAENTVIGAAPWRVRGDRYHYTVR